jgi:3-oxoacyl-[acyl-carrier protein] reductase
MKLDFDGKCCLVTGGSRGIGAATADLLVAEGARVAIAARGEADLKATSADLASRFGAERVHAIAGDMTDRPSIDSAVRETVGRFGKLDVVVANVGPAVIPEAGDDWMPILNGNLLGTAYLLEAALPHLLSSRGSAVAVSSVAGLEALGAPIPYVCAKLAVIGLVKELARRHAAEGVRFNVVAPGHTLAPGNNWDRRLLADEVATRRRVEQDVPMKRFGTAAEVARTIVFLASPMSSFTTGACVVVDGGLTRGIA